MLCVNPSQRALHCTHALESVSKPLRCQGFRLQTQTRALGLPPLGGCHCRFGWERPSLLLLSPLTAVTMAAVYAFSAVLLTLLTSQPYKAPACTLVIMVLAMCHVLVLGLASRLTMAVPFCSLAVKVLLVHLLVVIRVRGLRGIP